jgi:hypothetical protein
MALKKPAERVVRIAAPLPPIHVGGRVRAARAPVDFWMGLFLRGVAVLWIGEGLLQWLAVLTDEHGTLLAQATPLRAAALFFFCVLDLVAAVGLWLVSTWGAAVWIATIVGHALVSVLAPDLIPERAFILTSDVLLAAVYAALVTLSLREERRR